MLPRIAFEPHCCDLTRIWTAKGAQKKSPVPWANNIHVDIEAQEKACGARSEEYVVRARKQEAVTIG